MKASEIAQGAAGWLRPVWHLLAAIVVVAGLLAALRWARQRAVAKSRQAQVHQAAGATAEQIEEAQDERIRLTQESARHAARASAIRERVTRIANRLQEAGHEAVADLVREWNR